MSAQHSKFGNDKDISFSQMSVSSSGIPCDQPANVNICEGNTMSTPLVGDLRGLGVDQRSNF